MESLMFMDNIAARGSNRMIEEVSEKLKEMERRKRYTFNKDKSNYMVIKTGKEQEKEINIEVKKGKLKKVERHKYLGNWIGEKGDVEEQIKEMERKANGMIVEVKKIGKKKYWEIIQQRQGY